jgi:integral membrane protein (TIGR01906 family)
MNELVSRKAGPALSAAITAVVPVAIVGNALWLVLDPWLIDAQYALPGFPDDRLGLRDSQRTELAETGLRSVRPFDDGLRPLREARLPDGTAAFSEREIRHMGDVRAVIAGFFAAWAIALGVLAAAVIRLRRSGRAATVRRAARRGCAAALGLIGVLAIVALVDFDAFVTAFHGVFFEAGSWRFSDGHTLPELYPDAFWAAAAAVMCALIGLQAGAVLFAWRRK